MNRSTTLSIRSVPIGLVFLLLGPALAGWSTAKASGSSPPMSMCPVSSTNPTLVESRMRTISGAVSTSESTCGWNAWTSPRSRHNT